MNNKLLIGISGKKRAGKDTAALHLCETYDFERVSFADDLKELTSDLFDIPLDMFHHDLFKDRPLEHYKVTAEMMKSIGTENKGEFKHNGSDDVLRHTPRSLCIAVAQFMRSVDPNFWIDRAVNNLHLPRKAVISDMRFKNEAQAIKDRGGILIRINNPSIDTSSKHISETDLDNYSGFDFVIDNDSDKPALWAKLDSVMAKVLK